MSGFEKNEDKKPSALDMYNLYREYHAEENTLTAQRVSLFITVQAFLLATLGYSYQKYYEIFERISEFSAKTDQFHDAIHPISRNFELSMMMLVMIGFLSCFIAAWSIDAAQKVQNTLRASWDDLVKKKEYYDIFPSLAGGGMKKTLSKEVPLLYFYHMCS